MNREALAAALAFYDRDGNLEGMWAAIKAAARERLAQLPEKCPNVWHQPGRKPLLDECPFCHGSGRVYPQLDRIVEGLGDNPFHVSREQIVAVLESLGGLA